MCACYYVTTSRQAKLVSAGRRLSPVCSHRRAELSASLLLSVLSVQWVSLCGPAGLSLTARGTAGEEVSGHLPLPLHLDNPSAVQLVSVVDQHVVQVCGHLREDMDI